MKTPQPTWTCYTSSWSKIFEAKGLWKIFKPKKNYHTRQLCNHSKNDMNNWSGDVTSKSHHILFGQTSVISNNNFNWSLGRIGTSNFGADNQTHVGFFDIMFVLGSNCSHHINKSLDFFVICNIFLLFDPGSKKKYFNNLVLTKTKTSLNCSWKVKIPIKN